jgi:type IV secretory pathway component VirB8
MNFIWRTKKQENKPRNIFQPSEDWAELRIDNNRKNNMNALNIFLATSGFIITMIGFGIAIIRGAEWASKE